MIIDKKKLDLNYVLELDKIYQNNYSSSELLNVILEDYFTFLCPYKFSNSNKMFLELLKLIQDDNKYKIIEDDYLNELIAYNKINEIDRLDYLNYSSNFYLKNVKFKPMKKGNYTLSYNYYDVNELFLYDDIDNCELREIQHVGYFNKVFNYPYIAYKNNIWMNVTPFEINTMKDNILKAKGRVLALGLGLGYFPFMCSLKDDVKEIVIVENDKNIIELFNSNILPFFHNKNKIKVIEGDGKEYLKKNHSFFDFIFVDIYRNTLDGLKTFIEINCLNLDDNRIHFWLIKGIISQLIRCVLYVFLNEYFSEEQEDEDSYFYLLSKRIKKALKDYEVSSKDDIIRMLDYKYLLSILCK